MHVYVFLYAAGFRFLFIGSSPFSPPWWSPPFSLFYSPAPPYLLTVALFESLLGSLLRAS